MYRAIIADDENKVCQLIKVMGKWEELGIEIVDICHSGDDVWESIQKNHPDIVLTDIRMPVYDGLEIINKVNQLYGINHNICFIIISGYAEFDYARQAIQYNIINYLLKPLDGKQLNEALKKACNSLDMMNQQMENEKQLKQSKRFLEASCIEYLIERKEEETVTIEQVNQQFCTEFRSGYFQAFFLNSPFASSESENLFLKTLTEELDVYFSFCREVILRAEGTGVCLILNYNEVHRAGVQQAVRDFYAGMSDITKRYGEFQIYLGVGSAVKSLYEIKTSIRGAEIGELSRLLYEGKNIIYIDSLKEEKIRLHEIIPQEKFRELENLLEKLNSFEVRKWFSEVSNLFEQRRSEFTSAKILYEFRNRIIGCGRKVLADFDEKTVEKELREMVIALQQGTNLVNYLWILKTKMAALAEMLAEKVSQKENHPILVAKQYIQQNFGKQIVLTDIAEKLNFSSVYFGTMFKKHTGKTFAAYLTEVRMEQAKKYLKTSNEPISLIAGRVGYQDVKYFSKTFKAMYGLKPSEYRKMVSSAYADHLNI